MPVLDGGEGFAGHDIGGSGAGAAVHEAALVVPVVRAHLTQPPIHRPVDEVRGRHRGDITTERTRPAHHTRPTRVVTHRRPDPTPAGSPEADPSARAPTATSPSAAVT